MNTLKLKLSYSERGFTLIELMIVVVIVGIITAIALPNYRAFVINSRSASIASLLHGAISDAKSAARNRGAITICKSDNPDAPIPTCSSVVSSGAANVGWASGWISFIDANTNGQFDGGDTLIKVQPPLLRNFSEGSVIPVPQTQNIVIDGSGSRFGVATYFYVKPPDAYVGATYNRYVCVSSVGRVSVVKTLPC